MGERKYVGLWIDITGPDAGAYQVVSDNKGAPTFKTMADAQKVLDRHAQGDREGLGLISWYEGDKFPLFILKAAMTHKLSAEQREWVADAQVG